MTVTGYSQSTTETQRFQIGGSLGSSEIYNSNAFDSLRKHFFFILRFILNSKPDLRLALSYQQPYFVSVHALCFQIFII